MPNIQTLKTDKKDSEKDKNKSKKKEIDKDKISYVANNQLIKRKNIKEIDKVNSEENKEKKNNNKLEEENRPFIEKERINENLLEDNKLKENEKQQNYENSKISVDFPKEKVFDFLKNRINLDSEKLLKLNEEEIDGQALILLRDEEFKDCFGFKSKEIRNISSILEKDILNYLII